MIGFRYPGVAATAGQSSGPSMPSHAEWIEWMPSPPLVPDESPLDIQHLSRMTCGELSLEREVLAMFSAQAKEAADRLGGMPADAETLAHTLKGSARSVGAFRLADAVEAYEDDLRASADMAIVLEAVQAEVERVCDAIDMILKRS